METDKPEASKRTRRELNLEATRAHVVEAAARLFLAQGYGGTTVAAIAKEAGVAVQTVYNAVGGKAALLTKVFEARVSGTGGRATVPQMMSERERQAPDAAASIALLAEWFADVHGRMGPLWRVVDEGAAHDDEVAAFATRAAQRRLDNYGLAADALAARGGLPEGLDRDDVAALIWSVGHPQVYRALVEVRGWSAERYRRWAEASLRAALLRG